MTARLTAAGAVAIVACALLVGLTSAGCRGSGSRAETAGAGAVGGREGMQVAEFQLTSLDGQKLTPASLRGKVVIVDFWDTWCGPCLRAMPHLKELSQSHPGDVVVIAIALGQEGEAKVREVVTRQGLPFPVVLFEAQGDLTPAFGSIEQLPTTFLLGPDGVIRRRWVGAQSLPTYESAVKSLLPS
jgi:thiol-disulfide isomerase/thioredoxin